MIWAIKKCPGCGATVNVEIMSLAARCECGLYYADTETHRGWYRSREAYERGEEKLEEKE